MYWRRYQLVTILILGLAAISPNLYAKKKAHKAQPRADQDQIEVIAHLRFPSVEGPVTRLFTTQHYSRYYLYAEHASGYVSLLDITNPKKPAVLAEIGFPADEKSSNLVAVTGNAALVTEDSASRAPQPPRTVRMLSFADPTHPKVVHEFRNVTDTAQDAQRGLVFLASSDGDLWILREHFAPDPELEKRWEHDVLGDR